MKKILKILSLFLCFAMTAADFALLSQTAASGAADGSFVFNNVRTAEYLVGENNTSVVFSASERGVVLTASAASSDPYVYLDVESGQKLSADEYKYLVVTYKARSALAAANSEFFLCAGDVTAPDAGHSLTKALTLGGAYVSDIINLSADSGWSGTIHGIRYDYFSDCAAGDSITLSSIIFAKSEAEASELAAERASAANGDAAESVLLYDFKSESDVGIITAEDAGVLPGDVNSDGRLSLADSLLLKKSISGCGADIDAAAADTDRDGKISAADILCLRRHLAGVPGAELTSAGAKVFYSTEKSAAEILAAGSAPSVTVAFGEEADTDIYSYAVFTYILEETENTRAELTFSNGFVQPLELTADGLRHSVRLSYPAKTDWNGSVCSVVISTNLAQGERLWIDSIIFTESPRDASSEAASREEGSSGESYDRIIFDSADKIAYAEAENSAEVSFSSADMSAVFTVAGTAGDPRVAISYSEADLYADDYKYIVLTYKVPVTASASAGGTEMFLCAGSLTDAAAGYSKSFEPVKDGLYHYEIISLTDTDYWSGKINRLRFDFFSACAEGDSMYVDSVCLASGKAEAVQIGKERQALKNGTDITENVIEDTVAVNGADKIIKYYDVAGTAADGACTFSGQMTAVIDGDSAQFNRFHITYSTNAIIKGIAYYTVDGAETADEFFLENTAGQPTVFTSLITKYFAGKKAQKLTMIEFYTINTSSAGLRLYSVEEEEYAFYGQGTYFLENDFYKLGVDLLMGGGVNYLEYLNDNSDAYGNLLNNYDVGRLIQQSYYGIDRAPYEMGYWTDREWGYNPVQGGDKLNNISRIVDFEFRADNAIYVKARPMDWGQVNRPTPSYMENIYTLTDSYVHVYNRFVDFSGYIHTEGWQELPAFYTISALNNFSYYNGSSPWTNDSLITRSDLVFWGQVSNQAFDLKSTSEFWSAWTDNSGFGVGLYVPGVYTYHAGKFMYDGSADPTAASTNYVAPRKYLTLVCGKPLEYSYLVSAGSLSEIRETFRENRTLVDNYALEHYN